MARRSPVGQKDAGQPGRVLRLKGTIAKSGLGRDSIYRGAREGWFPKPIKLSERASGWLESEIDEWIERRTSLRDAGTPARPAAS